MSNQTHRDSVRERLGTFKQRIVQGGGVEKVGKQPPSLSNTVEQIRPVNGLTRLVRLVRPVQVGKQWFTGCTGLGSMVTCISSVTLHFNLDGTTRTTRTTCTGRETMVYES